MKGIQFTSNWKANEAGQMTVKVKIAKWYMPVFILKALRNFHVPFKYWPLFFFRYYTGKLKGAN